MSANPNRARSNERGATVIHEDQTLGDAVRAAARLLADEQARGDAEILIAHAMGLSRAGLFAHADHLLTEAEAARCLELIEARERGEPVAYLLGEREFWSLRLQVTPDVLIPRHETELLVEQALACLPLPALGWRIADLGTGSGAVALAIASERPGSEVWALDASRPALKVAESNAQRLAIGNVRFLHSDWFAALPEGIRFDAVVSNPPYVAEDDAHLERGDLRFEPRMALTPGGDGLDSIRRIIHAAPDYLKPGAFLLFEHGFDQGDAVRELLATEGFIDVETRQDDEDRDRVSLGRWR
jgi:release factor glutamine methyltransferase